VHVEIVNVPPPLVDQATVPVGVVWVPTSTSATVAVQAVAPPAVRVLGLHTTVTLVFRLVMVSVAVTTREFGLLLGLKLAPPL
jgi:hypothetical protein